MSVRKKAAAKPALERLVDFPTFLRMWNLHLGQSTPELHVRMARWLEATEGKPTRLLMCFREAAKSWLISLFIAWSLYRDPNRSFIMLSASQTLANKNAGFVRGMIENHPLCQHLVPPGKMDELWRRTSFTVVRSKTLPNPSVQALSLKGDIVGLHADLIFADDLETLEGSRTEEGRDLIRTRRSQLRSIAPKITYIGTPHAGAASMYKPMLEDAENIEAMVVPILTEDEDNVFYAWPEMRGSEYIANLRTGADAIPDSEWESQFLLRFVDMNAGGLQIDLAHEYSDPLLSQNITRGWSGRAGDDDWGSTRTEAKIGQFDIVDALAAWDPSKAQKKSDDSVAAIVARSKDDRTFLHHISKLPAIDHEGWKPQIRAILRIMKGYGITKIVVETNVNPAMGAEIRMIAEDRSEPDTHIPGIVVIEKDNKLPKEVRIRASLERYINRARFHIHSSIRNTKFIEQCRDFPHNLIGKRKNDWIDAAAFGILHLRQLPAGVVIDGNFDRRTRGVQSSTAGRAHGSALERLRAGRRR
ncbi:phage terminase large subunit [Reyranella massiliensis]|uniref:phage terminase large subunit n=1 Tax=Reyranella massiliensis TaxID=445220 RepID=UPI0002F46C35|nr:phage terminase large subunit [Reyranella massiliensis]